MILSDKSIYDLIVTNKIHMINPFNEEMLQPNSVDLTLSNELRTITGEIIDLNNSLDGTYLIKPNEFILGSTVEKVNIPVDLCGHVDGKSSIGRLGVFVHVSSGFIDSGFRGNITLEIYNCSTEPFELKKGMSICQILFETLSSPVLKHYGERDNHYQDSEGTVISRYMKEY